MTKLTKSYAIIAINRKKAIADITRPVNTHSCDASLLLDQLAADGASSQAYKFEVLTMTDKHLHVSAPASALPAVRLITEGAFLHASLQVSAVQCDGYNAKIEHTYCMLLNAVLELANRAGFVGKHNAIEATMLLVSVRVVLITIAMEESKKAAVVVCAFPT